MVFKETGKSGAESADHLPDSSGAGGNGREKGKNETQRDGRPGAAESVGIFKTGAEKQMIIKKPSFLSFHEAVLFPALSACVILKTPV